MNKLSRLNMVRMILINEEKQKEWDELDQNVKKRITSNLRQSCDMMENKLAIELLCNVINDLNERVRKLEDRND